MMAPQTAHHRLDPPQKKHPAGRFQPLEKFPTPGKTSAKSFQQLEKRTGKVPMIGKR
jgi:hypothetical protein